MAPTPATAERAAAKKPDAGPGSPARFSSPAVAAVAAAPSASAGIAAMVLATLLWGGTFVVLRDALHAIDPQPVVLVRFGLAGLVFLAVLRLRGGRVTRPELLLGALSGVLCGALYLLQAIGLRTISAGSSAFLTCTGSLFTALLAWPLLRQRPSGAMVLGMLLGVAGAALLSLDQRLHFGFGELITVAGALSYALGLIVVGKLGSRFDPVAVAAVQSLTTALCLVPYAPRALTQIAQLPPGVLARLAYLLVAGTLLAPWLQLTAQRSLSPGRVGLLLALEPVFALVLAVTVGHERFVPRWWLGAALILCAVAVVETSSARRSATAESAA